MLKLQFHARQRLHRFGRSVATVVDSPTMVEALENLLG